MKRKRNLDIIIPTELEPVWVNREQIIAGIREQHERYGFDHFTGFAPDKGWRSIDYPGIEYYRELARHFCAVREELEKDGITIGWLSMLTMKSGNIPGVLKIRKADGTDSPYGNCPLDPEFRRIFSENIAAFAEIAHPEHIIFEDDYSIDAAAGYQGCFCEHHLREFNRREQASYTRETLVPLLSGDTPESLALLRRWRDLQRDSLVGFSEEIRKAVDRVAPEVPIGFMQGSYCDEEGDSTEAICRALAGPRHTPFCRFFGTGYFGFDTKDLARRTFHPLYCKEHISGDFLFLHEADTYPQTRFFMSGAQMRSIMSMVYSYGFDGSTFQTQQLLDDPNEDPLYAEMFAAERKRFNALHRAAVQCRVRGVEIRYDPFYYSIHGYRCPSWLYSISNYGIPYTTGSSNVTFWEEVNARYATDGEIIEKLGKGLFLDAGAAKILADRGYASDIGVTVGDVADPAPFRYDLMASEVITEPFRFLSRGITMQTSHCYSRSTGTSLILEPIDPKCEVVAELQDFRKNVICPSMTRFVNRRGGKVVVYGTTIENNESQSLMNYRRQKLFQYLITWCSDEFAFVSEDACVQTVMNETKDPAASGFLGLLTLLNVGDDDLTVLTVHLPAKWQHREYRYLTRSGRWQPLRSEETEDGIRLLMKISSRTPVVIQIR